MLTGLFPPDHWFARNLRSTAIMYTAGLAAIGCLGGPFLLMLAAMVSTSQDLHEFLGIILRGGTLALCTSLIIAGIGLAFATVGTQNRRLWGFWPMVVGHTLVAVLAGWVSVVTGQVNLFLILSGATLSWALIFRGDIYAQDEDTASKPAVPRTSRAPEKPAKSQIHFIAVLAAIYTFWVSVLATVLSYYILGVWLPGNPQKARELPLAGDARLGTFVLLAILAALIVAIGVLLRRRWAYWLMMALHVLVSAATFFVLRATPLDIIEFRIIVVLSGVVVALFLVVPDIRRSLNVTGKRPVVT